MFYVILMGVVAIAFSFIAKGYKMQNFMEDGDFDNHVEVQGSHDLREVED